MQIIDIHTHLPFTREMVMDKRNLEFIAQSGLEFPRECKASSLISAMDAAGVDKACIMGPNPAENIAYTNDMVAAAVSAFPERLSGFMGVNPFISKEELGRQFDRFMQNDGFKGVGELGGYDLLTPQCCLIYEKCIEKDIPVLIHTGFPLPSMYMKYCHPQVIDQIAVRYPELRLIMAHTAFPWIIDALGVVIRHKNVYIDVSNLLSFGELIFRTVLITFTQSRLGDRILFGTDFPGSLPDRYISKIRRININSFIAFVLRIPRISKKDIGNILGGNAARLLKLP